MKVKPLFWSLFAWRGYAFALFYDRAISGVWEKNGRLKFFEPSFAIDDARKAICVGWVAGPHWVGFVAGRP